MALDTRLNALEIRNLGKTYRSGLKALRGIDLQVQAGDFFALLGPNGAGKSTTIGIISSLVRKSTGTVRVFDHDLDTETKAVKAAIGLVPQEVNFSQFEPVAEICLHQAGYYGVPRSLAKKRTQALLERLGLWARAGEQSRNLSGGMKRRLMIARALMHEPKLLILDEPTAGVDIETRRGMWQFLKELNEGGTTIILTTHYLEEAETLCRNIAIIDEGRIIENTGMRDLLSRISMETFVLDLAQPLTKAPTLAGFNTRVLEPGCIEVDVHKDESLNTVFAELHKQGLSVLSMRNKANRLEELFLKLVEEKKLDPIQSVQPQ